MSKKKPTSKERIAQLEARVQYLEGINRLTLDALDQASQLGDFQTSINKMESRALILAETRSRVRSLVPFEAEAIFLVEESESEFYLADCRPESRRTLFQQSIDRYIDDGTFAWALREGRPIFVTSDDPDKKILLHVVTTSTRTRGMFAGLLTHGEMDVPLISLSLMSIILRYSANALESFELYNMIRDINLGLEQTVADRTRKLQYQLSFEGLVARITTSFINIMPGETCHAIRGALSALSQFMGAEQYFLYFYRESEELTAGVKHLAACGEDGDRQEFTVTGMTDYPYISAHMGAHETLNIPDISELPDSATREKKLLKALGFKSAIVVPMLLGSEPAGFFGLGFKLAESGGATDISRLLIIVGEIFVNAIHHVKTEIALQSSREQLRQSQKMEALGRLAGGVAHDFNNILTAITIAAEVSLQYPGLEEKLVRRFHEILKSSERAADLTRQLLAVSRRQIIKPKILDAAAVTRELTDMLTRLIPEDIDVRIETGENLPPIKADPGQIEQILINLAVNARDAIKDAPKPRREKRIVIDISQVELGEEETARRMVPEPGMYILLKLSDTGSGMDEETRGRIFEPFFTTKSEGKGSGLGLATVYGIVTQNNGGISVESTPGKGTVFNVFWPTASITAEAESIPGPAPDEPGGNETILLVEDDDDIRNSLQEVLLARGYTVLEAENGQAALELVNDYGAPVDVLLTDVMMPVMGGRELAERLRAIMPEVKIIFTTGYSDNPLRITESLPANAAFMQKPYSIRDIARQIRMLLDVKSR